MNIIRHIVRDGGRRYWFTGDLDTGVLQDGDLSDPTNNRGETPAFVREVAEQWWQWRKEDK